MSANERPRSINPATEELLEEFETDSASRIEEGLQRAEQGFQNWSRFSVQERAKYLPLLKAQLLAEIEVLAELITLEMGKPLSQSRAEIQKCAALCDYYFEHGPKFLTPENVVAKPARQSYVRFDPLGAVLAVMPWNYPFWQVLRFAIPGLLAGNVCLLKHASNVTGCALRIQDLMVSAGFPPGVFRTLVTSRDSISNLIKSPTVKAVTLTGSEAAGRSIAEVAGRSLKKCVLELGGADAFLVLPDVDLPSVVDQAVAARTQNNGQSCIAAKRFLVHGMIYDQFVEEFSAKMQALNVGDPLDEETQIGPIAREDLRVELHDKVRKSLAKGGRLTTGGAALDRKGWFYEPTVIADVSPDMTCFQEEMFGPVASVTKIRSIDEGVELANDSRFGLGASIWTNDLILAQEVAAEIQSGAVFINQMVASHPSLPFGGIKDSGYGRELSHYGIREFVNVKSIWIR